MTRQTPTGLERPLGYAAAAAAAIAWMYWAHAGLVLSHYDAKAHLVVARRVFDNLTPGWQQIGAVWLPLPHLLNLLPTQIDYFYRTGAFASALSIGCFGVTAWAAARLVGAATGSRLGMVTAALLLALNPNLLYLHATPMTEPLLIAIVSVTVWWVYEWLTGPPAPVPRRLQALMFAAAWTRYEAWLALAALVALSGMLLWRRGLAIPAVAARMLELCAGPALAVALFVLNSRVTVGSWFVSGGFYVPDPTYQGLVAKSALAVWWGTHRLSSYVIEVTALVTAAVLAVRGGPLVTALSLLAPAALPFYAFVEGHPFRIRYMIPLVAACALFGGLAVGLLDARRERTAGASRLAAGGSRLAAGGGRLAAGAWGAAAAWLLAAVLVGGSLAESPPWTSAAPVIEEARWDFPAALERRAVTACLAPAYAGEKVLASMGSLAHYMQELSADGFDIADFIHEGNGTIWNVALSTGAAPHAGWMLVEEEAEGGDVLAQRIRADPSFARGMDRVCEGGGVALYRRDPLASALR